MEIIKAEHGKGDLVSEWKGGMGYSRATVLVPMETCTTQGESVFRQGKILEQRLLRRESVWFI